MIVYAASHPEKIIEAQSSSLLASPQDADCFAVAYDHRQDYLVGRPKISLVALVVLERAKTGCRIFSAILPASADLLDQIKNLPAEMRALEIFAAGHAAPLLDLSHPLMLDPVHIPKPWGQEIWYTGVEARGQSGVMAGGFSTPLPWLMSLLPQRLLGELRDLVLLKILDPIAEPIYGDLYFEMHEQKREVYLVTHIDEQAWPDKKGAIRLGFNPGKRAQFSSDQEFKQAYLEAVKEYEKIRREIDRLIDLRRIENHIGLNDPLDIQRLKIWNSELDGDLTRQEYEKREAMYEFTELVPLKVGDVIKVPCYTPHALQHGVRTIEFQTPSYERKILSFAQKVLTQAHWDTEEALAKVEIETPAQSPLKSLYINDQLEAEQLVEFDDFVVQRIHLCANANFPLVAMDHYRLLMVISGEVAYRNELSNTYQPKKQKITESLCIDPESGERTSENSYSQSYCTNQALLLPASLADGQLKAGGQGTVILIALPVASKEFAKDKSLL